MAKYTCPNCSSQDLIPASAGKCPACRKDLPESPNVRAANAPEEIRELEKRVGTATAETRARKCVDHLKDFGNQVSTASAVICRPIGVINDIVFENAMYASYYKQLDVGTRLANDEGWDAIRGIGDESVFPNYKKEIIFAALSLNGRGAAYYGGHSITLMDSAIKHRASVFEENTGEFCKKHNCGMNNSVPVGYRASWLNKGLLAKAKLHSKITDKTRSEEYPAILLQQGSISTDDGDFIEVNIYDGFSRGAIEKIVFEGTKDRGDLLLIKKLQKKLEELGIGAEIYSAGSRKAA